MIMCSSLDKLLGQLDIYATWLSSIAYLQSICIFLSHFFLQFLLNEAIMNVPEYSLPSSVFLKKCRSTRLWFNSARVKSAWINSAWFEGIMFDLIMFILLNGGVRFHNGSIRKMKNKENIVSKKK